MLFVHLEAELNSKKNPKVSSHWRSRKNQARTIHQEQQGKSSQSSIAMQIQIPKKYNTWNIP